LVREDEGARAAAHDAWEAGRRERVTGAPAKRRRIEAPAATASGSALASLKARVLSNSAARRPDPFAAVVKGKPPDGGRALGVAGIAVRKG
jgi:hypothetical protein